MSVFMFRIFFTQKQKERFLYLRHLNKNKLIYLVKKVKIFVCSFKYQ